MPGLSSFRAIALREFVRNRLRRRALRAREGSLEHLFGGHAISLVGVSYRVRR